MGGLLKKLLLFAAGVAVCAVILIAVFAVASKLPDGLGFIVAAAAAVIAVVAAIKLFTR
ncbi:MAG: hypothetical protein IK104_07360 [Clostridia bacterium]|nr:hypothetical protein [Clostridia bacterium]